MKRLMAQRKQFRAFGRGSLEFLYPSNRRVLAFVRQYEDEIVLVVANLSRFAQGSELDLSEFRGLVPVEVFGSAKFLPVTEKPYFLSLGPHAFFWLHLAPAAVSDEVDATVSDAELVPTIAVESFEEVFQPRTLRRMERLIPSFVRVRRWFLGGGRTLRSTEIVTAVPVPNTPSRLLFVRCNYADGDPDLYLLPLSVATGERASKLLNESPDLVLARLQAPDGEGVLYGAAGDKDFADALLGSIVRRKKFKAASGEILGSHTARMRQVLAEARGDLEPGVLKADQSNSSIVFGNRLILKLFRKLEHGINPDREVQEFLTDKAGFRHMSQYLGCLEFRHAGSGRGADHAGYPGQVHSRPDQRLELHHRQPGLFLRARVYPAARRSASARLVDDRGPRLRRADTDQSIAERGDWPLPRQHTPAWRAHGGAAPGAGQPPRYT